MRPEDRRANRAWLVILILTVLGSAGFLATCGILQKDAAQHSRLS